MTRHALAPCYGRHRQPGSLPAIAGHARHPGPRVPPGCAPTADARLPRRSAAPAAGAFPVPRAAARDWNGATVANLTAFPGSGNRVAVPLPGCLLEPATPLRRGARGRERRRSGGILRAGVPLGSALVATFHTAGGRDPSSPSRGLAPVRRASAGSPRPSRDLAVSLVSLIAGALAADGRPVPAATIALRNAGHAGSGSHRSRPSGGARRGPELRESRDRRRRGAPSKPGSRERAGPRALRSPRFDHGVLSGSSPLSNRSRLTASVELRLVTQSGGRPPVLRLGIGQSDLGVVQPPPPCSRSTCRPEPGWPSHVDRSRRTFERQPRGELRQFPESVRGRREADTVA